MRQRRAALAVPLLLARMISAQPPGSAATESPSSPDMSGMGTPDVLKGVTIEQRLNTQIPLGASFRDEYGQTVTLSRYFGQCPVILALVYYECPMLCTQFLNGVVRTAKQMTFRAGRDYDVVVISFDPQETPSLAMAKKQT